MKLKYLQLHAISLIFLLFSSYIQASVSQQNWSSDQYSQHHGDINGDGTVDLFLHSKGEGLSSYTLAVEQNGEVMYLEESMVILPELIQDLVWNEKNATIKLADFNGDGQVDLYVIFPEQKQAYTFYANDVGEFNFEQPNFSYDKKDLPWLKKDEGFFYETGDFDDNGYLDLLALSPNKGKHYFIYNSEQGFGEAKKLGGKAKWGLKKQERFFIGDFNNDGKDDIFIVAKKKNKPAYLLYADEDGNIQVDKEKEVSGVVSEENWGEEGNSNLLIKPENYDTMSLIKLPNVKGGYDEEGVYWAEGIPDYAAGEEGYRDDNSPTEPVLDPCGIEYFIPETEESGFVCAEGHSAQGEQRSQNKKIGQFRSAASSIGNKSASDFPIDEGGPVLPEFEAPPTPKSYPRTPGSSYKAVNSGYTMSVPSIPGASSYMLYESRTDSNYRLVGSSSSGNFSLSGFSTTGYAHYKYKACHNDFCSGMSPFRRLYIYSNPSAVSSLSAPSKVTLGSAFNLTWRRGAGTITHSSAHYDVKIRKPNGSTTTTRVSSGSRLNALSTSMTPNSGTGTYRYEVRGCNPNSLCGPWSSRSVTVYRNLETPTPKYPLTGSSFVDGSERAIRYQWVPVADATSYDFYIFDRALNKTVYSNSSVSANCGSTCSISPSVDLTVSNNHVWRVMAKSPHSNSSRSYVTFDVTQANRAPVISGTPAKTVNEGSGYSFTPTSSDPDGDSRTFSITGKPSWASFSTSTGKLSGTPSYSQAGTYSNIRITVSDGKLTDSLNSFSITVNNVNRAPVISGTPAKTVNEGSGYSFTPTSSDPDGDSRTFSITGKPSWASFSTSTGRLSGTPSYSQAETYSNIRITVSDGKLTDSLNSFSITVNNTNRAPTISGTPSSTVNEGESYSFTPTANDLDNDNLTFSITGKPSWASFSTSTGKLSGTPSYSQADTYSNIRITVSDGSLTDSLNSFSITVNNTNRAPTIGGTPSTSVDEGESYSFTPTANDQDNDNLTFSITGKPSWASFSTSTGKLSGTPSYSQAGTYSNIRITVSDGSLSATLAPFDLIVKNISQGLSLSGNPNSTVNESSAYSFTPSVNNPEGNTLTFSVVNKPSWASFNTSTGKLSGTPSYSQAGTYANIGISATDGQVSASLTPFTITVNNVNRAPTISGSPRTSVSENSNYSFTPTANDVDNDDLTFSITGKPSWATFNTSTGELSGTPSEGDASTYSNIRIRVSDGNESVYLPNFSIVVSAQSLSVSISNLRLSPNPVSVGQPQSVSFDYVNATRCFAPANYSGNVNTSEDIVYLNTSTAASGSHNSVTSGYTRSGKFNVTIRCVNAEGETSEVTVANTVEHNLVNPEITVNYNSAINNDYRVSWSSVTGASSYQLEVSFDSGASWPETVTTSSLSKNYTDPGPGEYVYRVKACDANNNCSDFSTEKSINIQIPMGQCAVE